MKMKGNWKLAMYITAREYLKVEILMITSINQTVELLFIMIAQAKLYILNTMVVLNLRRIKTYRK